MNYISYTYLFVPESFILPFPFLYRILYRQILNDPLFFHIDHRVTKLRLKTFYVCRKVFINAILKMR